MQYKKQCSEPEIILPDPTLKLGKVKIFLNFDYILNRVAQRFYPILRNSVPMLRRSRFGNQPYPEWLVHIRNQTGQNVPDPTGGTALGKIVFQSM